MFSKTKEFYDKEVIDFNEQMKVTGHYSAQKRLFNKSEPFLKEPILDLACGPGYLLSLVIKSGKKICANDLSKKMINYAKQNCNTFFFNKNVETIKTKTKFKTLIDCNIFYYINQDKAIKTWYNLLDKKGKIIVIEEYPFIITSKKTSFGKKEKELKMLMNPKSPKQQKIMFESNNFRLIKKYKTKIDNKHNLYCQIFEKV